MNRENNIDPSLLRPVCPKAVWHNRTFSLQRDVKKTSLLLCVLPAGRSLRDHPFAEAISRALRQQKKTRKSLRNSPLLITSYPDTVMVVMEIEEGASAFTGHTRVRKALQLLHKGGDAHGGRFDVVFCALAKKRVAEVVYACHCFAAKLPRFRKDEEKAKAVDIHFWFSSNESAVTPCEREEILAEANALARSLVHLPGNYLQPATYRFFLQQHFSDNEQDFLSFADLQEMGAGAFCAVAQASADYQHPGDRSGAGIARVRVQPSREKTYPHIALVGKGVCFDTGGSNLKPAQGMRHMKTDMSGAAVVTGILQAINRLQLPVRLSGHLALVRNDTGPEAYCQGDVITSLRQKTIEVVHTDAEGRMILSDALTLAEREQPDLVIDFASLTGTMKAALGHGMSGYFCNRKNLVSMVQGAAEKSGERLWRFPLIEEYEEYLHSDIADMKQCGEAGFADHIIAALFLQKFVGGCPWVHVDLAATLSQSGLGAVPTKATGFGVAWGVTFIEEWLAGRSS